MSCGCLKMSHGELKIAEVLSKNNIFYVMEKTFADCIFPNTNCAARFDFYVNNTYCIEFDGIQHFYPTRGQQVLEETKKRDLIKNEWCKNHNIPLIRIPYTHLSTLTIEDLLENSRFKL